MEILERQRAGGYVDATAVCSVRNLLAVLLSTQTFGSFVVDLDASVVHTQER